ncbi:MAG: methionine--tRNA ligase [Phycisphaerae bacterium]|nr:methionine--tRNA ligase [Phycisphaerae bacterium]
MPSRYLVTAALPYSNNRLHVGHIAGAYLPADTYVRYLRAAGHEVRFICGSDDNGVAIEISALQEQSTPEQIASHYHERQAQDFAGLEIEFDVYGGTHHPDYVALHEHFSQDFFTRIHAGGYFTKRRTQQLYDAQAGRFLPDRFVRGICHHCGFERATGDQCEACGQMIEPLLLKNPLSVITGQPAEVRETTHWYLRLSDFEKPLRQWLESKQGQWRANVLNFALGQIKQGLPERSMTRDIAWGVPVPLDDPDARGKVLYVWFDAPIGYMSFTAAWCARHAGDWQDYQKWWCAPDCAIIHFIGEDNTVFHALTWPAMLMAHGRPQLPTAVVANNFMNHKVAGELQKISKSTTAADAPVWVEEYLKRGLDPDALRYYLTAQAPEAARTAFDPEDFVTRNNSELVAALGNFVNRALTFAARYFEGRVPDPAAQTDADRAHLAQADEALRKVGACLAEHRFRNGLEELMAYARVCNEYFSVRAPWSSRKDDLADCAATIATCIHAIEYLAIMCWPFMPGAARKLQRMLGRPAETIQWAAPRPPKCGTPLGEPTILFAKLEPGALG